MCDPRCNYASRSRADRALKIGKEAYCKARRILMNFGHLPISRNGPSAPHMRYSTGSITCTMLPLLSMTMPPVATSTSVMWCGVRFGSSGL